MKEVYASVPTAIITVLIAALVFVLLWNQAAWSLETIITGVILLLISLWVVLSAMGKFPLYRLR